MKAILIVLVLTFYAAGISSAQEPGWAMAFQIGSKNNDKPWCVTTDASNNLYVAGRVSDTACFPQSNCFPGLGNFLAKFDASGQFLWVKNISSDFGFTLKDATIDATGNLILTGSFTDTLIIGTQTFVSHGGPDALLLKYDSSGNIIWMKANGGTGSDEGAKMVTDASGNIYVTGNAGDSSFSSMPFPGGQFLAKYDKDGNEKWVKLTGVFLGYGVFQILFTGAYFGLDVDGAGNIYTSGAFRDSITIGSTSLTSVGDIDAIFEKFDENGDLIWVKTAGGKKADRASDIAVDNLGNLFIVGVFRDTAFFGTQQLIASPNATRYFMAKYSQNGTLAWVDTLGNIYTSQSIPPGVFVGHDGNAYVTNAYGSVISKYNGNGNLLWAKTANVDVSTRIANVEMGKDGSFYFTGAFNTETFLPPYSLQTFGSDDIFVARLASTTSVHEMSSEGNNLVVYPNPSAGIFAVKFESNIYDALKITDMLGRIVYTRSISISQSELKIELHNISPGIYFLQLSGNGKSLTQKILVE